MIIQIPFKNPGIIILTIFILFNPNKLKSQGTPKYNVLFIAVDDMNDRCSFLGNDEVLTPNLQRLVNRGMVFKLGYCQYPLCNPSRTSLLSGWRPDKTKVITNTTRPRSVMGNSMKFLPEYFKQYGYTTERYGKIMHDTFEDDITWDYSEPNLQRKNNGKDLQPLSNSGGSWWVKSVLDTNSYDAVATRNLAARLRQPQRQRQPFFYGFGLHAHNPFTPSLEFWNLNGDLSVQELLPTDKHGTITDLKGNGSNNILLPQTPLNDRSDVPPIAFPGFGIVKTDTEWKKTIHAYDGTVAEMDANLGVILDEIDRENLWDSTIIVFWSDHGQHLGEHEGTWLKNTLFEESIHVPLIVCVPGKAPGTCSRLIEYVDLYPTLAELCGLPAPAGMQGISFAQLFDNPSLPWKKAAFSQLKRNSYAEGQSVRTERFHYNAWGINAVDGEELYDHFTDPNEYTNLAGNTSDSAILNKMRKILAGGWTQALPPVNSTQISAASIDEILQKDLSISSPAPALMPNPSNGRFAVKYYSKNTNKIQIKAYDITGKLLTTTMEKAITGSNVFPLDFSSLASGMYYLEINNSNQKDLVKFIIEK